MYIGENKTALLSQKMIADAMRTLLQTRPYSGISISDLCRQAGISRQTFYSLFGTKENVLLYLLSNSCLYDPEPDRHHCRSACFRDFCKGYSHYIIANREILQILVKNDMMHCLYDIQYRNFMDCEDFIAGVSGDDRIYLVDFIASGMNSIAKNYVLTGCCADEEALEELMYKLFAGIYFSG